MNILLISGGALSFILLAVHFLRSGEISLAFAMIFFIALIVLKRHWSRYISAIVLTAGIPVWMITATGSIQHSSGLRQICHG